MRLSNNFPFPRVDALTMVFILLALGASTVRADEVADARMVADSFLKLLDHDDAEGAYQKIGEQWKRTSSKAEFMAGVKNWLQAKGGSASTREIVLQRTLSKDEARQLSPTVEGSMYIFRYRSKYPKGVFFEDLYVNRDSDGVMRIQGHHPQPAE